MTRSSSILGLLLAGSAFAAGAAFARTRRGARAAPGADKALSTSALEVSARALQRKGPLARFDLHLVGLHPMKDAPHEQLVAHHFCHQVNEDFMQCVLFDGAGEDARLTGVEYIISERLFETLPDEERRYWHPHNYEIFSGTLAAPRVPRSAETALLKKKINSYGKTWHFWRTGGPAAGADPLPFGEPHLAWSFNRDGEADPALVAELVGGLGIDVDGKRRTREGLARFAHPQLGVCALRSAFPWAGPEPEGVEEAAR